MAQFHDAPARYLAAMRAALPLYDRMQDAVAAASEGLDVRRMLDLGIGTGETARRCLQRHPGARVVGLDASAEMLDVAAATLGERLEEGRLGQLEDALPAGPFELVTSALAVHHLDAAGKVDLFHRIHDLLAPGGRFVMADVVVPEAVVERPTPLDRAVDNPDTLADLLAWLGAAGLRAEQRWQEQDVVVVAALRAGGP